MAITRDKIKEGDVEAFLDSLRQTMLSDEFLSVEMNISKPYTKTPGERWWMYSPTGEVVTVLTIKCIDKGNPLVSISERKME